MVEERVAGPGVRALKAVRNSASRAPARLATDSLHALAQDLPRLWHAETTSSLVADVTLLPEWDAQTMRIGCAGTPTS